MKKYKGSTIVEYNGKKQSIYKHAKEHDISPRTVLGRLNGGLSIQDTFTLPVKKLERHGMRNSPEYSIWCGMKDRCSSPNHNAYHNYGGRGIKVCDRWNDSFLAFYEDMGPRPSEDHTIDRIDNDGNYEPNNCRWVTWREQSNNRRGNVIVTHNGKECTISELSSLFEIPYATLRYRISDLGWSVEDAVNTPLLKPPKFEYNGVMDNIKGHCERLELNYSAILYRMNKLGMSFEDTISTPVREPPKTFEYDGVVDTVKGHCRRLGYKYDAIRYRMRKLGKSFKDAVHLPTNKFIIGPIYGSIEDILNVCNIERPKYFELIDSGLNPTQALEKLVIEQEYDQKEVGILIRDNVMKNRKTNT